MDVGGVFLFAVGRRLFVGFVRFSCLRCGGGCVSLFFVGLAVDLDCFSCSCLML